ncbi:MAG: carbohydrate ABC transporter permease [Bdellovibrionales bacterium]|nr:carbohydrate ABC transporter permease [Bdellovibrionales bacterium]
MVKRGAMYLLLLVVALFCTWPILWQFITSLKPEAELISLPPVLPNKPTISHYQSVLLESSFIAALKNSFLVAIFTTLISLAFGGLAAFALAKLNLIGSSLFLAAILSISMFPPIATISPLYVLVNSFGLRDTVLALVGLYSTFSLPLSVWILTSFFKSVPDELLQAARVDGCSTFQIFYKIMLPVCMPGLIATTILVFIFSWNEFLLALTFSVTEASRTVPVAIALFPGLHEVPWGEISAASIVVTAPIGLLVFMFQRKIVAGLTAGSVKG